VTYEAEDGQRFINGDGGYASSELHAAGRMVLDKDGQEIRKGFDGKWEKASA
jgi:hypothetical protein